MTAQGNPSVEELRRESERSRAVLTSTVIELQEKVSDTADELKTRLSPSNIKEEVKDYVRDGSAQFFQSIERKARANPLQTVAIGAALSYPLWALCDPFHYRLCSLEPACGCPGKNRSLAPRLMTSQQKFRKSAPRALTRCQTRCAARRCTC